MANREQLKVAGASTRFQPGNPGRPKGARNKLGEAFVAALLEDFKVHGVLTIQTVREDDPSTYMRILAGLLPREIAGPNDEPITITQVVYTWADSDKPPE